MYYPMMMNVEMMIEDLKDMSFNRLVEFINEQKTIYKTRWSLIFMQEFIKINPSVHIFDMNHIKNQILILLQNELKRMVEYQQRYMDHIKSYGKVNNVDRFLSLIDEIFDYDYSEDGMSTEEFDRRMMFLMTSYDHFKEMTN